jgi:homoserine kinase type II
MAVFTPVNAKDLALWLEGYSVGELVSFRGIASGIENSNFFLTTSQGEYVLTLFERLSASELPFYLELMQHLAAKGVRAPAPLPRRDGTLLGELQGKPATIVSKLEGSVEYTPSAQHCLAIGDMLARLHLAGRDFLPFQPNLRSLPWWQEVVPKVMHFLTADQQALLQDELLFQRDFFHSADYAALPGGPCHCDVFRDNVLFDKAGRLTGLFDFYFAGCDKWLFDLAVCANDWCIDLTTGHLDPERTQAFLRAYQRIRPFTPAESIHWPTLLRTAAMRFWISRLYDFYLPRCATLLHPHDPKHFERILCSRRVNSRI